jgi:hypothetical protein
MACGGVAYVEWPWLCGVLVKSGIWVWGWENITEGVAVGIVQVM